MVDMLFDPITCLHFRKTSAIPRFSERAVCKKRGLATVKQAVVSDVGCISFSEEDVSDGVAHRFFGFHLNLFESCIFLLL